MIRKLEPRKGVLYKYVVRNIIPRTKHNENVKHRMYAQTTYT